MKRHLFGFSVLIVTLVTGFLASPIHFSDFAIGSDEHGGFHSYVSSYLVKLSSTTHRHETLRDAAATFEGHKHQLSSFVFDQKILEADQKRFVISFKTELSEQGFCVVRKDGFALFEICSESLNHVLAFEKQRFAEN